VRTQVPALICEEGSVPSANRVRMPRYAGTRAT
jgi:hypothetical protein